MDLFGVLIGLVAIGYTIFYLVLPFIIKGGSSRLGALEKRLSDLEGAQREQAGDVLSNLRMGES